MDADTAEPPYAGAHVFSTGATPKLAKSCSKGSAASTRAQRLLESRADPPPNRRELKGTPTPKDASPSRVLVTLQGSRSPRHHRRKGAPQSLQQAEHPWAGLSRSPMGRVMEDLASGDPAPNASTKWRPRRLSHCVTARDTGLTHLPPP